VLCRAAFGVRGANVPAILRRSWRAAGSGFRRGSADSRSTLCSLQAWSGWAAVPANIWIAFLLFWALQVWIIVHGLEGIKKLEGWSAPLLLAGGALLLGWAIRRGGRTESRPHRIRTAAADRHVPFWQLFPAAVTANVGYWATLSLNIPDFTRYARSQRSQALGQAFGLPATMTAFAFIGVAVTSATIVIFGEAIWDPVALIARIGSPATIIFGALIVCSRSSRRTWPPMSFRRERFFESRAAQGELRHGRADHGRDRDRDDALATLRGRSGVHLHVADWLFEPDGGDRRHPHRDYWVLRGKELALADLFAPRGRYSYGNGVNMRAIGILVVSVIPVIPGFIRAAATPGGQVANPTLLDTLYTYAWFVTFGLSSCCIWRLAGHERSARLSQM
jgi:NCS1 family nucleobase:cation symporter-1